MASAFIGVIINTLEMIPQSSMYPQIAQFMG